MNKSYLTLLTVEAVGPGEVPYKVNVAAGEKSAAERACKVLNAFVQKKWTPAELTMFALMSNKKEKTELLEDLAQALTMAQAKRIMKALENVYVNHRIDVTPDIFDANELTAI